MSNIESVKNEAQERYPAVVRASDGHLSIIHRDSEEVFIAGRTVSNEQVEALAKGWSEAEQPMYGMGFYPWSERSEQEQHEVLGEE